jgi:Domain of unknown function (DUF4111)
MQRRMTTEEIKKLTPYQDINDLLALWTKGVNAGLGENVVGLYLTGSLTYGDFVRERSDLDLCAIVRRFPSADELESIRRLHQDMEKRYPVWEKRIECSYVPVEFMREILPPTTPRPWWGFGVLYADAPYGNEWIINQYFLFHFGMALAGPELKTLVDHVDIKDVQKASARDLFQEWRPKTNDLEWLANSHYQSYLILNLCRILYAVLGGTVGSKKAAAAWVKNTYPQWTRLIEEAEAWQYGMGMYRREEVISFIRFAVDKVGEAVGPGR